LIIIESLQCLIPVSTFLISPFYHIWGSRIYAKVIATNYYGDSAESNVGGNVEGVLITNPDMPMLVQEISLLRTSTSISISWIDGFSTGGSPLIEYEIYMSNDDDMYGLIGTELIKSFTATELIAGNFYKFIIQSRNIFYYSAPSIPVRILCASIPEIPEMPWTTNFDSLVFIYWPDAESNGLPLTSYSVLIKNKAGNFIKDLIYCIGSN
jgi:hypothetical protein